MGFAREWEKLGANPSFSSSQAIPTQDQYSPQEKPLMISVFSWWKMTNVFRNPLLAHPAYQCRRCKDMDLVPWLGRSPGIGNDNPRQYPCLENPHGQRSLAGYSPWGCKELDTTERLSIIQPSSKVFIWVEKSCLDVQGCVTIYLSRTCTCCDVLSHSVMSKCLWPHGL